MGGGFDLYTDDGELQDSSETIAARLRQSGDAEAADLIEALSRMNEAQAAEIKRLRFRVQWAHDRLNLLQKEQARMPDPWRTLVCDIIANGHLMHDPNGARYGAPPR